MNILLDDHKSFAIQLLKFGVEFILVGGYAVVFHGYVRTTGDMDIWLKPDNANRDKFIAMLRNMGIVNEDLSVLQSKDFSQALAFHIDEPPTRIDFLTKIVGVSFDEANQRKVLLTIGEYEIPVLHLDHLLANKLISGRTKDKADVEELQRILKMREEDNE